MIRKERTHEIFVSPCLDCEADVESRSIPVPLYCTYCTIKREKETQKLVKDKREIKKRTVTFDYEKFFKDHEICPTCQSPRIGISDGRLFYKCGHVFEFKFTIRKRS